MARYTPDLTKATAGIKLLPKGDYEFKIGEPKLFSRQRNENDGSQTEVFGVSYGLTVVAGDQEVGTSIPMQLYMHTEKTAGMNKRFVMAALGYSLDDEPKFNEDFVDADWSVDTEENEIGEIWKRLAGQRVAATADIVPNKQNPNQQNQQFNWRPI